MTSKLNKVYNLLKKELNVRILSVWTEKSKCCFLYCIDNTGNFFFINMKPYNIYLQDQIELPWERVYIDAVQEIDYNIFKFYEKFTSNFQKYLNRILYYIDDYLILNQNNIYKVIHNTKFSGCHCLYPKYEFDWLYENKWNFTSEILSFNDDILRKTDNILDNEVFPSHRISEKIPEDLFINTYNDIQNNNNNVDNYKKLYINLNSFEEEITKRIKALDDFSAHKTVFDTRKQIEEKTRLKQKVKNLENIRRDVLSNLQKYFREYSSKINLFIYYKSELDKKFLNLESTVIEFERRIHK